MYRALAVVSVVVSLGVLSWAAPGPKQPATMVQKLNQRANCPGIPVGRTTLDEALAKLSKLYDVSFEINETAFKLDGLMEVGRTEVADPKPIPEMKNARLERVLRQILCRIPAPSGTTFYVRSDRIEITTGTFQSAAVWGAYTGPHLPLINITLDKMPLEDAVRELADQTDLNIVVDARAGERARATVSARLLNTPLDTALRLLTDMTDLRAVHIDNVFYITTKENAAALDARLEKEKTPTNPLDDSNEGQFRPRKGVGPDAIPNPNQAG